MKMVFKYLKPYLGRMGIGLVIKVIGTLMDLAIPYLLTHIMVNLGGVMGLIPLTGVPLPFLSYGGSYAICLMVALGLVQRVAIENNKTKLN